MIGKTISHYKILEKLGEGGMGVVYKAEDTKLKRTVALKFLIALKFLTPQGMDDEEEKKRFVREAQAAAALNHPNICTIYEIDETEDGDTFIAMEYIDGVSIKEKTTSGPLKLDEALDIAIQTTEGLNKAHSKGIVHRDIKSVNVMVNTEGQVKIMDFGLAKLAEGTKLTVAGTTMGTVAYMSPEQARGEDVDKRTDIWSFGVMLYEMVSGQLPFRGEYEQAILYSLMNVEAEPLTGLRTGVPMELEKIVNKCLDKKAYDRYPAAEGLIVDLRRLKKDTNKVSQAGPVKTDIVETRDKKETKTESESDTTVITLTPKQKKALFGGAAAVIVVLVSLFVWIIPRFFGQDGAIDSLVILPFEFSGAKSDLEYLSESFPRELVSDIQTIPDIKIIAFSSVLRKYREGELDPVDIGKFFDVRAVVSGSFMIMGNQLSVSIEILDSRDQTLLLAENYSEDLSKLAGLQTSISRDITEKLSSKIGMNTSQTVNSEDIDPEAYREYLLALYHAGKVNVDGTNIAIEKLRKVISLAPEYAPAYVGLSRCYAFLPVISFGLIKDTFENARLYAQRALELKDYYGPHYALGRLYIEEWKWDKAREELDIAYEMNPNHASTLGAKGMLLVVTGEAEKAIPICKKAIELDPLGAIYRFLAWAYMSTGNYEDAIENLKTALNLNPEDIFTRAELGFAYRNIEQYKESAEYWKEWLMQEQFGIFEADQIFMETFADGVFNHESFSTFLRNLLELFLKPEHSEKTPNIFYAIGYYYVGNFEKAIEYLNIMYEVHDGMLPYFINTCYFEDMHGDKRFIELAKKLGLYKN